LLVGIGAGILLKLIFHLLHGAPFKALFKAPVSVSFDDDKYLVEVEKAAIFSNYLGIKDKLEAIPQGMHIIVDLSRTAMVDNSVLENLHHFEHDYKATGGEFQITGLHEHKPLSDHIHAPRKKKID